MPEHSAEWWRGFIAGAERYAPSYVVKNGRKLLAEAEAREAGTPKAARILYACQCCGEEFGEGEQESGNRCPHCRKGQGDPIGECPEDPEEIDEPSPTAADLAVADELDLLAEHIREYIAEADARDEIRRICRNRADDLRKGVKRAPSAVDVIAAAKKALEDCDKHLKASQWQADCDHLRHKCDAIGCNGQHFSAIQNVLDTAISTLAAWEAAHK